MNGGANGDGFTRGSGAIAGTDGGTSGILTIVDVPPEEPGRGMKTGGGDLFLVILLRPWRSVRSPSRNV